MKNWKKILNLILAIVLTMLVFYTLTLRTENKKLNQAARNWQNIILYQQDSITKLHKSYEYKIDSLESTLNLIEKKSILTD